jgi:hypothetical protein
MKVHPGTLEALIHFAEIASPNMSHQVKDNEFLSISLEDSAKGLNGTELMQGQVTGGNPELRIIEQSSVTQETSSKHGITKLVHVVVKNLTFTMEVASNAALDLTKWNFEAKLLYDFDRDDDQAKEVSFVKNEPLDYKVNIADGGQKAIVELKIKVLTSQHEDMLFR